jgi:hypothetical protein
MASILIVDLFSILNFNPPISQLHRQLELTNFDSNPTDVPHTKIADESISSMLTARPTHPTNPKLISLNTP